MAYGRERYCLHLTYQHKVVLHTNQNIYVCFMVFEKAFGREYHEKLLELLKGKCGQL